MIKFNFDFDIERCKKITEGVVPSVVYVVSLSVW